LLNQRSPSFSKALIASAAIPLYYEKGVGDSEELPVAGPNSNHCLASHPLPHARRARHRAPRLAL